MNSTKQWSLLDNDKRKRVAKKQRTKPVRSVGLMPLSGEQMDWALNKHLGWVLNQVGEK